MESLRKEFQGVKKRQGWKGVGEKGLWGKGVGNAVLGERHTAQRDGTPDLSGRRRKRRWFPFLPSFSPATYSKTQPSKPSTDPACSLAAGPWPGFHYPAASPQSPPSSTPASLRSPATPPCPSPRSGPPHPIPARVA